MVTVPSSFGQSSPQDLYRNPLAAGRATLALKSTGAWVEPAIDWLCGLGLCDPVFPIQVG